MRTSFISALSLFGILAFTACDVRVKSDPPTTVEKKETTIVNPASEKKVENNTTIVNPPADKK
jgi:hypothetical protein